MRNSRRPLRIAFIGWGAINRRVAGLLTERQGSGIAVVAVCLRDVADAAEIPADALLVTELSGLADLDLDIIVEAAGRSAVSEWGEEALRRASAVVFASTSAFCDEDLLDRLVATAEAHGSWILIPQGALAGIDGIAAASILALDEVVHKIVKPPRAWLGTPAEKLISLDGMQQAETFFSGSAREAAGLYPQNANVAVISALAGIGLDRTRVALVADPTAPGNRHELTVKGEFGRLDISIENRPLESNPKTSEMAALGIVRIVENSIRRLVV